MARGRETARGGETVLHDLDRREPLRDAPSSDFGGAITSWSRIPVTRG